MPLTLTFIILLAIFGNFGIARYKQTEVAQWVMLSLLVGPLSWPFQWNASED